MKKDQTGKRKENNSTRKKYVYTKRAQLKIQQNRKMNENKARKGQQRQQNQHVRKMNFQDNLHT